MRHCIAEFSNRKLKITIFPQVPQTKRQKNRGIEKSIYLSIYLSIYIHTCCEVLIWSKFGGFRGYYLVHVGVIIWSKFVFWPIFIVVSSDFCTLNLSFCVFCLCPIIWQLFIIVFFKRKEGCFAKHYKIGFQQICVFLFFEEKQKGKEKKITGISGCVFCPKMAVSWCICFFFKKKLLNPPPQF